MVAAVAASPQPSPSRSVYQVVKAGPSGSSASARPSQSLSTPSQASAAAGETSARPSSQSPARSTWVGPAGSQVVAAVAASPQPSPSLSVYQVKVAGPSGSTWSISPSQSLSMRSQASGASGAMFARLSSQSPPRSAHRPGGGPHWSRVIAELPQPSPSTSAYQVRAGGPSSSRWSTALSQSLSASSQTSAAFGKTCGLRSSQSPSTQARSAVGQVSAGAPSP